MKVLGIIPARGGSKRVPNKNIRLLNGKPLIHYTIETAKKATLLDKIIVTTDDEKIAKVCKEIGAEVPFIRPGDLAQDNTPDKPVIEHALNYLKNNENFSPDIIVILRPTTPFKTAEIIDSVIKKLQNTKADSVRTMTKVEGINHPFWMYKKKTDDIAVPFSSQGNVEKYFQSQQLPPVYQLNGVVDAIKVEAIRKYDYLYGKDIRIFEIDEEYSVDIDTEMDFQIAEMLLIKKIGNKNS